MGDAEQAAFDVNAQKLSLPDIQKKIQAAYPGSQPKAEAEEAGFLSPPTAEPAAGGVREEPSVEALGAARGQSATMQIGGQDREITPQVIHDMLKKKAMEQRIDIDADPREQAEKNIDTKMLYKAATGHDMTAPDDIAKMKPTEFKQFQKLREEAIAQETNRVQGLIARFDVQEKNYLDFSYKDMKKQLDMLKTALTVRKEERMEMAQTMRGKTDEQLVRDSLTEQLGRKPTNTEVLAGVNKLKEERTGTDKPLSDADRKIVDNIKKGMSEARIAPSQLNTVIQRMGGSKSLGKIRSMVASELLEEGFDMAKAELNYKAKGMPGALQSVQLAKATAPLLADLETLAAKMPKEVTSLGPLNMAATAGKRALAKYSGNEHVTNFEALRNDLVQEVQRLLTMVGAQGDARAIRALENLATGYNTKQMKGSLDVIDNVIAKRQKAVQSDAYMPDFLKGGEIRPLPKF